jgi:DNA polymerase-3 subunit epsilon
MLPCYVMLDLETTGGNAGRDRITEIAAVRVENAVETARWSTLVNPGVPIPPFIQSLTGISDAMVADAPAFEDVAGKLLELLEGAVLVAHNVRFDHGFLLNAFARNDVALKVKTLCTVRLSRTLYPQHKGHGLDAIMQRHGLNTMARHRAMGDVDVVLQWLRIAAAECGDATLRHAASELLQGSACVPPQLETALSDIPDSPGVYLFYGEGPFPLYIGKSAAMRTRVLSHFQSAAKVAREMRILTEIRRVEWIETAGELGALLLELRLVKDKRPVYNRKLRRETALAQPCLQAWPHTGWVAIREYQEQTDRTDIHVFHHWCHLATVHDETALEELHQQQQPARAFDLDTYRLLQKRLLSVGRNDPSVFVLNADLAHARM